MSVSTPDPTAPALRRRSLGVADLVFFIVAASAPLTAVAGGQAATYLVTGNKGVPFLFIPLGIMLGLFAVGYAAMSRYVADAGAFYTYVARGLGKIPAVGTAFLALISYNAMQLGIYGLFGVATAAFASDKLGITMEWYWWCLIAGAVIAVLGVLRVDLNAKVLAVALTLEVIIVAIFDFAILADPGPQGLTLTGFDPSVATGSAFGAALVFCVASFVGFESAAIYSEEAKDPKRTVAKATFIGVGLIAVFYALSSWLLAASVGPDTMVNPDEARRGGLHHAGRQGARSDHGAVRRRRRAPGGVLDRRRDAAVLHQPVRGAAGLPQQRGALLLRARPRGRPAPRVRQGPVLHRRAVVRVDGADPAGAGGGGLVRAGRQGPGAAAVHLAHEPGRPGRAGADGADLVRGGRVLPARRRCRTWGRGARWSRRLIAGVLLVAAVIIGLANFNVLITSATDAPTDDMTIVLPIILFGGGALGLVVGAVLKSARPDVYAQIGEPSPAEEAEGQAGP